MSTGTSKWVYESTEIIPYKKTDCKFFAFFVPKYYEKAHFLTFVLVFSRLDLYLFAITFTFGSFCFM